MSAPDCPNCGSSLPLGDSACPNCATMVLDSTQGTGKLEISGYEIVSRIGEGGMGAIYLAEETSLGRRVAIKVVSGKLATDQQAHARFLREARSLATIEHANVVRIYAFGDVGGMPYLAMEYVDGETLAHRIHSQRQLSVEESIRTMRQIVLGLEAAWEKGIVHRDIKPSNVLIDKRGSVHVADFGLAKPVQRAEEMALTQSGHVLGTPYYLAPEQAQGKPADFRADIYSCGILLYEMLAGERPFEGTTPFAIVAKHLHDPMPPIRSKRPDVPNRVERLLTWMTEKTPERRPASYAELLASLDALLGFTLSRPIAATETLSTASVPRKVKNALPLAIVLLVIAAVLMYRAFHVNSVEDQVSNSRPADSRFVIAVAPFYGPDPDSEREGRQMAALIERSIKSRLGEGRVRVLGIDETKSPVRGHDAARELGKRLGAAVVIWGEVFALRNETEIQPYFTRIDNEAPVTTVPALSPIVSQADLKAEDPTAKLAEQAPPQLRIGSDAPNQFELRKTSAEGVGGIVSLLAAVYALYTRHDPEQALAFLDQAPPSSEALRYRAEAKLELSEKRLGKWMTGENQVVEAKQTEEAIAAFEDSLKTTPNDAAAHVRLADFYILLDRPVDAALQYRLAAQSGQPYTTRYGIYYDGRLYGRESYRIEETYGGERRDSGYLLALDPATGTVLNRYRMPGSIVSLAPVDSGFKVTCEHRMLPTLSAVTFNRDHFDQPLIFPGGNLMLRMQAMKSAWVLPQNFISELTGIINNQPAHPAFRLKPSPSPESPASLPALEIALRAAMQRDPTQPWHRFFLGETLAAERRSAEAGDVWTRMLASDFPVPYTTWPWMAKYFERMGQRDWADRAWEKAIRERRRNPQPPEFTTLIERLINVPVMRLHPSQLADPERSYAWLVRARTLSGITEGDHLAAAAWVGYFRRHHDPRAEGERRFLELARNHPMNYTAQTANVDYAIAGWMATWFGLLTTLVLAGAAAVNHVRSTRRIEPLSIRHRIRLAMERTPRLWRAVLLALLISAFLFFGLVLFVLGPPWVVHEHPGSAIATILILACVIVLALRRDLIAPSIAALTRLDRLTILAVFLACLAATLSLIHVGNQRAARAEFPIGLADSVGHPTIVADFERRLAKHDSVEARYCAAAANDYGGNRQRATQLYKTLPNDPRAARALAALQKGRSAPEMPSGAEIFRSWTRTDWRGSVGGGWNAVSWFSDDFGPDLDRALASVMWGSIAVPALVLITFLFIPHTTDRVPVVASRSRWRRVVSKTMLMLFPGGYDIHYRSPLRGALMLTLTGFVGWSALACWKAFSVPGAVGILSAMATPGFAGFPLPPAWSRSDLMFAAPHAAAFWSIAIAAILALIILHATRLREIWSLYVDGDPAE